MQSFTVECKTEMHQLCGLISWDITLMCCIFLLFGNFCQMLRTLQKPIRCFWGWELLIIMFLYIWADNSCLSHILTLTKVPCTVCFCCGSIFSWYCAHFKQHGAHRDIHSQAAGVRILRSSLDGRDIWRSKLRAGFKMLQISAFEMFLSGSTGKCCWETL